MRKVLIPILFLSVLGWQALAQGSKKRSVDRRLSLDRIQKLVTIHTPDGVIAGEIQSRGISSEFGRKDIDRIRQMGGGPETVAAMLRLLPMAVLTVRTQPGAAVQLDGNSPVTAGDEGAVTLSNIEPGLHRIAVERQYFKSASQTVTLKGRENASLDVKLDWAVGFLTVQTSPAEVQIQVADGPSQTGQITRMPVPIGQVQVAASAPLRRTAVDTVTIEPGKEASVSLVLPADEAAIHALKSEIQANFQSGLYQSVLLQARRYLGAAARDSEVLSEMAISDLEVYGFDDFKSAAQEALRAGGTLRIPVLHHHAGLHLLLHPAVLELSATTLGIQPQGTCTFEPFNVPLTKVRMGKRRMVMVSSSNDPIWAINLNVPNPSNSKKEMTINLGMPRNNISQVDVVREFTDIDPLAWRAQDAYRPGRGQAQPSRFAFTSHLPQLASTALAATLAATLTAPTISKSPAPG